MAKKGESKRIDIMHHSIKKHSKDPHHIISHNIETKLVENLVELQKVHTHLAEKFDKLSDQISNLLGLFEMAARSFSTHPSIQANEKDKEFLEKIDRLLDQNKTIAKGLTLMEERIRERVYGPSASQLTTRPEQNAEIRKDDYQVSPPPNDRTFPRF